MHLKSPKTLRGLAGGPDAGWKFRPADVLGRLGLRRGAPGFWGQKGCLNRDIQESMRRIHDRQSFRVVFIYPLAMTKIAVENHHF